MVWSNGFGFTWRLMRVSLRQLLVQRIWKNQKVALNLMNSSSELSLAIKAIREALVVEARGVNLKLTKPNSYLKIPAWIAGKAMKVMFAKNELTRKIMTLHNDKQSIFYCCSKCLSDWSGVRCEDAFSGSKYEGHFV